MSEALIAGGMVKALKITKKNNFFAGVAQLVERQPSKLNVVGSIPITRFRWRSSVGRAVDL